MLREKVPFLWPCRFVAGVALLAVLLCVAGPVRAYPTSAPQFGPSGLGLMPTTDTVVEKAFELGLGAEDVDSAGDVRFFPTATVSYGFENGEVGAGYLRERVKLGGLTIESDYFVAHGKYRVWEDKRGRGALALGAHYLDFNDTPGNVLSLYVTGHWVLWQAKHSPLLRVGDVKDPGAFIVRLRKAQDPVSQTLRGQFPAALREKLTAYDEAKPPARALQQAVVDDLNRLLQGPSLYGKAAFGQVVLSSDTQKLLAQNPQGQDLVRLNRMLLADAYPQHIAAQAATSPRSRALRGHLGVLHQRIDGGPGFEENETRPMLGLELRYNENWTLAADFLPKSGVAVKQMSAVARYESGRWGVQLGIGQFRGDDRKIFGSALYRFGGQSDEKRVAASTPQPHLTTSSPHHLTTLTNTRTTDGGRVFEAALGFSAQEAAP